jgi:hypothetical protein
MSNFAPPNIQAGLLRVLHRALIQARNLALRGECQQLYDLADTFELLPELMAHWDESTLGRIRSILTEYESNHPQSGYEYVSLLDGEDPAMPANGFDIVGN